MKRSSQAGFTAIEVMVSVALVGVLAKVALPSFMDTARKAKDETEVTPFFAELHVRQQQFFSENGGFKATSTGESDTFPAAPNARGTQLSSLPQAWSQLRIRTPQSKARCTYVAVAGVGGSAGPIASSTFGFTPPESAWYYLLARCSSNASKETVYFASNKDNGFKKATLPASVVASTSSTSSTPSSEPSGTASTGTVPSSSTSSTSSTASNTSSSGTPSSTSTSTASTASSTGTSTGTSPTATPPASTDNGNGAGNGNGNGSTTVHSNSGAGNGTECVDGVEVDPGNSGTHNNSPEGSTCGTSTTTGNGNGHT